MATDRSILVYADWDGLGGPTEMGRMEASTVRGQEVLSFEYSRAWLDAGCQPMVLDPALRLTRGAQYAEAPFGLFLDSAPDRWGRLLIDRREAYEAREQDRRPRRLSDTDYLLGVCDRTRMGGLRFKTAPEGVFLAEEDAMPVPPLHALRTLEQASLALETADTNDPHYREWLRVLVAPGSSLGGARPKCNAVDPSGDLWIAKFPSRQDRFDVGAWEGITHALAREAGVRIAPARVERFSESGHTFMVRRFDRHGATRVHYASAMTLLGHRDGDDWSSGVSYLDLAELIETSGESIEEDLRELWRRIVFSVAVGNGDDHLRNHGFLLGKKGWRLSPAFDVNPQPSADGLSLSIDETSNALDLALVRDVRAFFRVTDGQADRITEEVTTVVSTWEARAAAMGVTRDEIERMRPAFRASGAA